MTVPDRPLDPRYVEARRVLLDGLMALAPHKESLIVVGAQAVYLRTGTSDIAIAPFTTDCDLALDPTALGDDPRIEEALRGADFSLFEDTNGNVHPGSWIANANVGGTDYVIPLDLLVPESVAPGPGRRGARLGPHGNQAARKVRGIEAALIDHDTMTIAALDPVDSRTIDVAVAGCAALLIAKAHKIGERVAAGKANRYDDKDGADVYRLMQTTDPAGIAGTMATLRNAPVASEATISGLAHLRHLFARRGAPGIAMAQRTLREIVPEDRIATISTAYMAVLFDKLPD